MFFKGKKSAEKKERILTVLDIGSSKIACFIAKIKPKSDNRTLLGRCSDIEVLGYGVCLSKGIKNGLVTNMREAELSIKYAVAEAEKKANIEVKSILIGINSSNLNCKHVCINTELKDKIVNYSILDKLKQKVPVLSKRTMLHCLPIEYHIDDSLAIENPIDMVGDALSAKFQTVDIKNSALQNIEHCLQRCYLDIEGIVAAPFASALAVLLEQEMAMGGICIDIGADTTSCAVFMRNKLLNIFNIPCGSSHITKDIEQALEFSFAEAEKLKCIEGFLDASVQQKNLVSVITARAEEILQLVHKKLIMIDKNFIIGKTIILTGGGSYLAGYTELAESIFKTKVRLGRPLGYSNIKSISNLASCSTVLGLLAYPQYVEQESLKISAVEQKKSTILNNFLSFGKKINKMIY